jgi:hypothetical protein
MALGIERLGVRHAAAHPQHDERVGGRREPLGFLGAERARIPGGERA